MIWTLIILVVAGGWYWYQGDRDRYLFTAAPGHVCANLDANQANAWLGEHPETQVLDVRSEGEFKGGALPQAMNISIGDSRFDTKVSTLNKETPVLVYCAGGSRSRIAVTRLKQLGFKNIQHIHCGYMSWKPNPQL